MVMATQLKDTHSDKNIISCNLGGLKLCVIATNPYTKYTIQQMYKNELPNDKILGPNQHSASNADFILRLYLKGQVLIVNFSLTLVIIKDTTEKCLEPALETRRHAAEQSYYKH